MEMDLDEWEFLPDRESFLDLGHGNGKELNFDDKMILEMDYFICPSQSPPPPIKPQLDSAHKSDEDLLDAKEFEGISVLPQPPPPLPLAIPTDRDISVAQVFFKKMKENEFVDMKVSSPQPNSTRGMIMPHVESDPIQVKEEEEKEQMPVKEMVAGEEDDDEEEEEEDDEKKPWLEGIGSLFSIGVAAAATISILVLGGNHQKQQHQKIQFQIYNEDKRFKQALSGVRGAPVTRAHISFGGYYEGL